MKSTIKLIAVHSSALVAAIFVLAGCQKDILLEEGLPIRFAISAENVTKGELINTDGSDKGLADKGVTSFKASAYNGTSPVFTTPGLDPANVETVSYSGGFWTMAHTYYWPQATGLTFFACANMPSSTVASVAFSGSGLTLNYTSVPEDVTAQKDILLGHYQGNGGNTGTAQICFRHPLTAIVFKRGVENLSGDLVNIKRIRLSGIAASGTVRMEADGTLSTWEVSDYSGAASLGDGSTDLSVDGTTGIIGGTDGVFLIIPQNTAEHNITVTVTATTLDGPCTFTTTISSTNLEMGKTNTFVFYPHATRWLEIEYRNPWPTEETF